MKEKMAQVARTCPVCGEQAMAPSTEPILVEFRDDTYSVVGFTYETCSACGESLHPAGQIDDIQRAAVTMARRDRGLLTPDEIRRLRTDLGLTQVSLEGVLGVGPKSVTRWEKGTVFQSAVADRFMRLIWAHPEILGAASEVPIPSCADRMNLDCYATSDESVLGVGTVKNDFALAA